MRTQRPNEGTLWAEDTDATSSLAQSLHEVEEDSLPTTDLTVLIEEEHLCGRPHHDSSVPQGILGILSSPPHMNRLSTLLAKVIRKCGLQHHVEAGLIVHHANAWLSEHLPTLTGDVKASHFGEDGVLMLACAHSVAAQECQLCLPHLAVYLRETCSNISLKSIRIIRSRDMEAPFPPPRRE
jgi:hypothetical protein